MRISISKARARLAELADYVMAVPGRTVFIEQRGRPERLVLMSESYMKYLEEMTDRASIPGDSTVKPPFKVRGSLKLSVSIEEFEASMAEAKAERIREAEAPVDWFDDPFDDEGV